MALKGPMAAVEKLEQVTNPAAEIVHRPANTTPEPSAAVRKYACLPPLSRGRHSYQPSAGTRQRRARKDGAKALELSSVSARALIIRTPMRASFAHARTRPPRATPTAPPPLPAGTPRTRTGGAAV